MAKNEVATTEQKFELVTISGELAEAIAEEMDGMGSIPFEKVKIPSGGGLAFELPGEDEDNPTMATELVGVILDHHPVNAYWENKYSGGNEQPDCSSYDGKQGVERETVKSITVQTARITSSGQTEQEKLAKTFTDVTSCRKEVQYRSSLHYRQHHSSTSEITSAKRCSLKA